MLVIEPPFPVLAVHDLGFLRCRASPTSAIRCPSARIAASWPWATKLTAAITRLQAVAPG